VTEDAGDGPVLVHWEAESLVVESLDEGTQALPLPRVVLDIRPIVTHGWTIHRGVGIVLAEMTVLFDAGSAAM
jgi:hypothetical protein